MKKEYITPAHLIVEAIGIIANVVALVLVIVYASTRTGEVPTHYDLMGNVDGYGSAWGFLSIPIIMLVTTLFVICIVHFVPVSMWNMPVKVKPECAVKVYRDCAMAIAAIAGEMGILSLLLSVSSIIGKYLFAVSMIMILAMFATIIVCMVKAAADNRI